LAPGAGRRPRRGTGRTGHRRQQRRRLPGSRRVTPADGYGQGRLQGNPPSLNTRARV